VTRVCTNSILSFYTKHMKKEGVANGQSGAVVVVQRTSPDLKLNPHLHAIVLDGAYRELDASTVGFNALPHLSTRDVGEVIETICARLVKLLRRRGLLVDGALEPPEQADAELSLLAASAVSGQSPPAGPEWRRRMLPPLVPQALAFDKPLCASKDGCTALRSVVLHGLRPASWTPSVPVRPARSHPRRRARPRRTRGALQVRPAPRRGPGADRARP
jgi:hypothetical protein